MIGMGSDLKPAAHGHCRQPFKHFETSLPDGAATTSKCRMKVG